MAYNDDEKSLLRRQKPARRTPRDEKILPRRKPKDPSNTKPFNVRPQKPRKPKFMTTDSLSTSIYAKPFRQTKNLTDSLGTASPVARKYRKLGSK